MMRRFCALILTATFSQVVQIGCAEEKRAHITVDCSQIAATVSEYAFGAFAGPFNDPKGLALCREGGFTLIEPLYDLRLGSALKPAEAAAPRLANTALEVLGQVEKCLELGMAVMPALTVAKVPEDPESFKEQILDYVKEVQKISKHHDNHVRLFRFGNEPEFRHFWSGSYLELFQTFELWARAIKAAYPDVLTVGPGFAFPSEKGGEAPTELIKEFIQYCDRKKVPLDVLAIHNYGVEPYISFGLPIRTIKNYIRSYPNLSPIFGTPKVAVNEWNFFAAPPGQYNPIFDSVWTAAHNAAAMIEMLKQEPYIIVRNGGCSIDVTNPHSERDADFILITKNYLKKPSYSAMEGINRFLNFPHLVSVKSDSRHFVALAGLSKDQQSLYLAVSHYPFMQMLNGSERFPFHVDIDPIERELLAAEKEDIKAKDYRITLDSLPFAKSEKIRFRCYRVDEKLRGELVEEREFPQKERIELDRNSRAPGVDFIIIDAMQ
ncbi:MAG: hypothetical protein RBS57_00390 [Desulforhabdus sp.]|nr:hypothetical protein [Desulforhabdus sp.]